MARCTMHSQHWDHIILPLIDVTLKALPPEIREEAPPEDEMQGTSTSGSGGVSLQIHLVLPRSKKKLLSYCRNGECRGRRLVLVLPLYAGNSARLMHEARDV